MFRPVTIESGPQVEDSVLAILGAAIAAVNPRRAVAAAIGWDGHSIEVAGCSLPIPDDGVRVIALGKAAVEMTWGMADALPDTPITGVAATPHPTAAPAGIEVMQGAHPTTDHRSVTAGHRLMEIAASASHGDVVVVLVSGGGSACAELPAKGLAIEHLASASDALLTAGVAIGETNTVRRELSLIKGGALAAACAPALVVTLVVSDVVGNDLATIAGGPTVANPTGPADALAVIENHDLATSVGPEVMAHLRREGLPRRPFHEGPVAVVADASTAAQGALAAATRLGIAAEVVDVTLTGEARFVGQRLAGLARIPRPLLSIFAGETTVTVQGPGSGGRNQEVALAAALVLEGTEGSLVASLGTDGIDGPTSAAGGVVDGGTIGRGMKAGLDARAALAANDSGTYLEGVGGRLVCGPTGTNVGDVMLAWGR